MKIIDYPVEPPKGIFHFPQGVFCLVKEEDTGKEDVKITRISGDEFEFEITLKELSKAEKEKRMSELAYDEPELDEKERLDRVEGSFKQEKENFPIRVCEYEQQEEKDLGEMSKKEFEDFIIAQQKAKIIVKSEKKIDITVNNKHRQVLKDGELLKIGNTVTYSAGTNIITLDDNGGGTSWATAWDMDDLVANCGAVVTKQGANAYDISARLKFLSGVYFVSKSEFVELRPNPASCAYTIQIDAGAHVKLGEYNSTDKYGYNGSFWRIYTNSTTLGNNGNVIYGEFLQYGSNVWNDATAYTRGIHFKAGSTIRQYNSIMRAKSYFWAVDHDLQDVKWFGTGAGTYDMLVASGFNFNWGGLTTMDCNYGLFFSGTTTSDVDLYDALILDSGSQDIFISSGCPWLIRVINPVIKPVKVAGTGSGKQGVQICYTFNVKVTDGTNPIVGATVELKDKNDDVVFSEQTISGGVLANDKIVKVDWYRHANDGGHLTYNDHTLKVTSGADETGYKITIDHQISEDIILIPQSTASYDNIMAGINDMKGTDFVKDTHSLTNIKDKTNLNEVLLGK